MPVYRANVSIKHPVLRDTALNTWHARVSGPVDANSLLQEASDAIRVFYEGITGIVAGGTAFSHDGEWLTVEDEVTTAEQHDPWTVTSGTSAAALPPHLALVAGWGTSVRTRSGYGRTFVSPLATGANDTDGTPSSSVLTQLRAAMDSTISASQGLDNSALGVYSRKDGVLRDFVSRTVHDQFAVITSRR